MKVGRAVLILFCCTLLACPNNGTPVPEDAQQGGPCSEESASSLNAGSWTGSSFETLENGDSPSIEFGSLGGIMASFDLLATGVGSSAKDLKVEFRSIDGNETYQSDTFSSVSFACQNTAGQVLVDMAVEVSNVPMNEAVLFYLEASFESETGDPILIQSETEIVLTL